MKKKDALFKNSKKLYFLGILLCLLLQAFAGIAQPNTEIFLIPMEALESGKITEAIRNISNNKGYDNQPSFYNDSLLLFASTRNELTDIAALNLKTNQLSWKSDTPDGSEYSPLRIPQKTNVSAIRLDTDGTQLLYEYDWELGSSSVLLEDMKVGYHLWFSPQILISTVLIEDRMDLVISDLKEGTLITVFKNVGRSLHKIPDTELISFISKEKTTSQIRSLNPITGEMKLLVSLPLNVQDICWISNSKLIHGNKNQLFQYDRKKKNASWELKATLPKEIVTNISRLATDSKSGQLAIVAEIPGQ